MLKNHNSCTRIYQMKNKIEGVRPGRDLEKLNQELLKRAMESSVLLYEAANKAAIAVTENRPDSDPNVYQAQKSFRSFLDSANLISVDAFPRQPRESDRVELLPGQHNGFVIKIFTDSGYAFINLYGGLRYASDCDLHDSLTNHRKDYDHAHRTDAQLDQPTHLNIHLADKGGEKIVEVWMILNQVKKEMKLSKLFYKGKPVSHIKTLNNKNFKPDTFSQLLSSISCLTGIVPSAV